jgi:predicted PurR-regulated permease PerM
MSLGKWVGLAIFLVALYILWQVRQLLFIIFSAVLLATALNIIVRRLQRSGAKRGYAVVLTLLIVLLVLAGFGWIIVPPFTEQIQELIQLVPQGIEQLTDWLEIVEDRLDPRVIELFPDLEQLSQQLQPIIERLLGGGLTIFSSSLGILLNTLLVLVLTLMILADPDPYRRGFVRLFPSFYRRRVDKILLECDTALQGWLSGILFNMLVITVLSFVGLMVLGIPLALSQALVAGLLTFIPNIGPTLSVIPPIAIALLEDPWKALAVLILYIIIQQVESNLLTPFVMAQQVSLLPAVTLLAQVFFATFFGFLGLFLALPLTVVAQVWLKEVLLEDILDHWGKPKGHEVDPPIAVAKTSKTATDAELRPEHQEQIIEDLEEIEEDENGNG